MIHGRMIALAAALALGLGGAALAHEDDAMGHRDGMDHADHMDRGGGEAHHHGQRDTAFGHRGKAADVTRTIAVTMNDITFTPDRVAVKAGETIRFTVSNASGIEHDFTLGDAATQAAHRKEMAEAAEAGTAHHHHHGGNAVLLKAGGTGEVIWTFTKPGTFEFDCNVPGHFEAGMTGTLTVAP